MSGRAEEVVEGLKEELRRSKVGVLVIHGIGEQESGGPLLNAAEPLFRWFSHAFGKENVKVTGTDLKGDVNVPANTTFEVQVNRDFKAGRAYSAQEDPPKAHYKRCLFAEANWAGAFRKPGYKELVTWALLAIPNVIATQFARGVARLSTQANHLSRFPGLFLALGAHFVSLFIALLIQIVIAALLPLAVIPGVGSLVVKFQQMLASVIGDSLVFVDHSIQQNAIISKAQKSLEWLSERCNVIVVVAHSQGAAVGYSLLTSSMSDKQRPKVKLFLTLGSGLGKLNDLVKNSESGLHRYTGLAFVLLTAGILVMQPAMVKEIALPMDQKTGNFLAVLVPMFGAVVWHFLLSVILTRTSDHRKELVSDFPLESIRWIDRYARYDLVPAGPLVERDSQLGRSTSTADEFALFERFKSDSCQVNNFDSMIFDHTTYWDNEDQFVSEVGRLVAAEMGEAYSGGVDEEVTRRRRWRLTWRTGLMQFAAGLFLLAVWHLNDRLTYFGELVRGALDTAWSKGPERLFELPRFPDSPTEFYATGLSLLALYFLVLTALYVFVWNLWNQSEIRRNLKQETDERDWHFTLLLWAAIFLPLVVLALFPGTNYFELPFESGSLQRNVFFFSLVSIPITSLGLALPAIRLRDSTPDNVVARVVALLPIAVVLSWLPARYLAQNYSASFMSSGVTDVWAGLIVTGSFCAAIFLVAVVLFFCSWVGSAAAGWLRNVFSKFGNEKNEQSVGVIGAFGVVTALLAMVCSMFVPEFYSREALLFVVLATFAYLASANTLHREGGDAYTVTITCLLLASIGAHGQIRNWWLGFGY